jgi:hypothetical protein
MEVDCLGPVWFLVSNSDDPACCIVLLSQDSMFNCVQENGIALARIPGKSKLHTSLDQVLTG